MARTSIALAYCIDNLHTAEGIEKALAPTDYSFDHFYCKRDSQAAPLAVQMQDYEGPILLLISDNFLRSVNCMQRALQLVQQKGHQLLPVVIDGFKRDENGDLQPVITRFEKIGDIIPYINYWQNQYLDLRGQRKRIEDDDDYNQDAFTDHLRILRQVSSEASEFLRVLRNMSYLNFAEFTANHFEAFFEWLQDEEEWEAFRAKVPEVTLPGTFPDSPLEEEEDDRPDQQDPSISTEPKQIPEDEAEAEEPIIRTEDIPGLDLLEESENIARIINQKMNALNQEEEEGLTDDEADTSGEVQEPAEVDQPGEPAAPIEESARTETPDIDLSPADEPEEPLPTEPETPAGYEPESQEGKEPPAESAWIEEGLRLIQSGAVEQGLTYMNQGLEENTNFNDLRYHYALMLAQNTSDFSAAINQLYTLLEMDPDHVDGNFLMGELAELEDHYDRAREYYAKVADLDEDYPDVFYRLGIVTLNHFPDEKKRAAKYFKKAAKRNRQHVDAHYQYALLMNEHLNKPHKALKYFLKVSELEEDHPFVHYDLALLYYQNDDKAKARAYYQKAVALNPELKTEENDRAFLSVPEPPKKKKALVAETPPPDPSAGAFSGEDTIQALKENIRRLETLIKGQGSQFTAPTPQRKVVFITGATSGIGKATAYVFAREGYRLILNGRRADRLVQVKEDLQQRYGSEVLLLPFDVSDHHAVESAVQALEDDWNTIDVLVNNAGKAKGLAPIYEGQIDHWEEMIDVNLKGLLYLTRAVTPLMVKRGRGHVINICSTAGKEVYPKGNVYCATKHAVEALTQAMRLDLYEHNIRVSQVSPAHVEETEFAEVRFDGDQERARIYEDFNPLTSHDVAEAILFMATRPPHVNVQDILMMGTQQANSLFIDRSGRRFDEEE